MVGGRRGRVKKTTRSSGVRKSSVRPRRVGANPEELAKEEILASLDRLVHRLQLREMRLLKRRATTHQRSPHDARRDECDERLVALAHVETDAAIHLRRQIAGILEGAAAQFASIEQETYTGVATALAAYHAARALGRAMKTPKPSPPRNRSRIDISELETMLEQSKLATAVVIADRNRLMRELEELTTSPDRGSEADEVRRELVVQDATAEQLKHGLRVIRLALANQS
jgi:hypothetical protein